MKQVIRKGLKDIIVDEVPDPVLMPHHVLVRPLYSLISSGTETASIHRDSLLKEVGENPSHLRKIWNVAMKTGPLATIAEVRAKFTEYAVLVIRARAWWRRGTRPSPTSRSASASRTAAKEPATARRFSSGGIWQRACP